jgi:hypothetical protein
MKTAEKTEQKDSSLASDQPVTYSISQAAKRLKRSESMTKKYKATLLAAWTIHTEMVVNKAGSLTEQGLLELLLVQHHYAGGNPDGYAADLYKRERDLFSDLAIAQASGPASDGEMIDVDFEDFIPDGAETREETALALSQETRALGRTMGTFNTHLGSAQGRLYAMIRSQLDPVTAMAVKDSIDDAVGVLEGVGAPANPTQG